MREIVRSAKEDEGGDMADEEEEEEEEEAGVCEKASGSSSSSSPQQPIPRQEIQTAAFQYGRAADEQAGDSSATPHVLYWPMMV